MALFRKDVLANAEKLVSKGRIEAAIKEYRKVLAKTPGDTNTLNRVGDLYVRLRKTEEAVGFYMKTAEQYALDGFYVKAIAVYKKVHRLDPSHVEVHRRLGELYRKQGLLNDALRHFNLVAEASLRDGKRDDAIALYEQLIELEPANPTHYLRLADIHREAGRADQALHYYGRIATLMLSHGQIDHAVQVYERALQVDARNLDFISEAVVALKEAGGEERARRFLDTAVEANPAADQLESLITPPKRMPQSTLGEPQLFPQSPGAPLPTDRAESGSEPDTSTERTASAPAARQEPSAVPPASAPSAEPWPLRSATESSGEAAEEPEELPEPQAPAPSSPAAAASAGVPQSDAAPPTEPAFVAEDYDPSEDSAAFEFQPEPDLEIDLPESLELGVDRASEQPQPPGEVELDPFAELLEESEAPAAGVSASEEAAATAARQVDAEQPIAGAEVDLDLPKAPLPADFPGVRGAGDDDLAAVDDMALEVDSSAETSSGAFLLDALDDEEEVDEAPSASMLEAEEPSSDLLVDSESLEPPAPVEASEAQETLESDDLLQVEERPLTIELGEEPEEVDERIGGLDEASQERLQEAEVFAKYGLIEKALERLDEVLEAQSDHAPTLARWLELGLPVRPLDDSVLRARSLLRVTGAEGEEWSKTVPLLREAGLEVEEGQISLPRDAEADEASLGLSSFSRSAGETPIAVEDESPTAGEPEAMAEADFELEPTGDDASQSDAAAAEDLGDEAIRAEASRAGEQSEVEVLDEPSDSAASESAALESGAPDDLTAQPAGEELPTELEEELALSEGTPASGLPAEVVTGDESISAATWLREPDEASDDSLFEEEDELFDLAAELQDELGESMRPADDAAPAARGEDEQSLEEIVEGFKRGVSENIPQEDADTHYNLGIAYREMMLLDEAITEFEISAKAEDFLVESCAMLGICLREKGQPEAAIDWYRKALASDQLGAEQRLGMLYEIGQTYESMSDEERAYETFLQIQSEKADYRDISDCVERLRPAS